MLSLLDYYHRWHAINRGKGGLGEAFAGRRKKSYLTQAQLAKMLKSIQSRVAKMEKEDPSISVGLLVKSLLAMEANKERAVMQPRPYKN